MPSHIVIPLDGSLLAETILPHALTLARAISARVTLLRVISPTSSLGTMSITLPENWFDEEMAWSQEYLSRIARRWTNGGEIRVHTEVLEGDPATEIITYARKEHDVTLIAMATHGWSGGHRWIVGSVTTKVAHALPTSLLLLHPHGKEHVPMTPVSYRAILVPLDGSRVAEQVLDEAKRLAWETKATLFLFPLPPVSQEYVASDYLEQKAVELRAQAFQVVKLEDGEHPVEEILHIGIGLQNQAGLVAMASHGYDDRMHSLVRNILEKFLLHAEVPILLVRVESKSVSQYQSKSHQRHLT